MYRAQVLCVILYLKFFAVQTFNLASKPNLLINEPVNYQLKKDINQKHSSYFGYTIVLREKSIIIGAPRAQTVQANSEATETGAIYKYNIASNSTKPIVFENIMRFETFDKLELNTTEQWLGGAMDGGSRDEDPLIVCAPQLKALQPHRLPGALFMHGVCYWTNSTIDKESQNQVTWILNPFGAKGRESQQIATKGVKHKFYDFGMGELGFSVHMAPNNEEIIAGAPGKYNWAGAAIHFNMQNLSPDGSNEAHEMFTYKGYAVGSGYFESNNRQKLYYVATVPKGNQQLGQAQIYTKTPAGTHQLLNLAGDQYGEFFGYALLVEDLNGDSLDDILIGAPYRTVNGIYEAGAVYVYINQGLKTQLNFKHSIIESPFWSRGRFGAAFSALGDINGDGYKDIAIGAPFADDDGAVAIYFGSPTGLDAQPRQILNVSDHFVGGMFGHGLSKGVDIDANGFNDLAIGAPNADTVFVYHAYPVVKINATIRPMLNLIPTNAKSLEFEICVSILTNSTKIQTQEILLDLKVDTKENRVDISNLRRIGLRIAELLPNCVLYESSLTFDPRYVFVPIVFELSYRLKHDAKMLSGSEFCKECVVVDPHWPSVTRTSVQYMHNCVGDVCFVDLQLQSVNVPFNLTLGTTPILPVKYVITNVGEEAYNTELVIKSSINVPIAKLPAECVGEFDVEWRVVCNLAKRRAFIGNAVLELSFDLSNVAGVAEIHISAAVSSTGIEKTQANNLVYDTVKLITTAEIWIVETSMNEIAAITDQMQNITVATSFEIQNIGPSPLSLFDLLIEFPIGYIDEKSAVRNYINNISAQVHIKDFVYPNLVFEISPPVSPSTLNTTEILNLNHLTGNRAIFLNCQSNEKSKTKMLCALSDLSLQCGLQPGQNITLELSYEIHWPSIENLLVNNTEYLVHVPMVDLKADSKLNGFLSIKRHLKGAVFVKINKRNTLWIYIASIIGSVLLLVGVMWLLKRLGFFKRVTKEEMEKNFIEKQEKARMKEELDECVAEIEEEPESI